MASPSDVHTPQSQKAAFSLCVPREAGLVLTLCPPWRPWKDSASMAHSSSLGGAALSAASPFLLQSAVGPPKPFLYNKDPHHLNNYHLHVLHHEPSWVSICRLRARWKKAMKMKEWEKRSVSRRAHKEKLLWESSLCSEANVHSRAKPCALRLSADGDLSLITVRHHHATVRDVTLEGRRRSEIIQSLYRQCVRTLYAGTQA